MKHKPIQTALLVIIFFVQAIFSFSHETTSEEKTRRLTIGEIMEGEEFIGSSPSAPMWSLDSRYLYFRWKKPEKTQENFYRWEKSSREIQKIEIEDMLQSPPVIQEGRYSRFFFEAGQRLIYNRDKSQALLLRDGDISLLDVPSGKITPFILTDERASSAGFSFDQKKIVFVSSENLFLLSLEDGTLQQMTSFSRKDPPQPEKPGEILKWYRDQQIELFKEFQKRQTQEGRTPSLSLGPAKKRRKPFHLKKEQSAYHLEITPAEKKVIFFLSEEIPEAKETIVPDYVTRSGYTQTIRSHTKAAHIPRKYKAGIMDTGSGEVAWLDWGMEKENIYPSSTHWSPDGRHCLLTARSEDRKNEWIFLLDPEAAKAKVLFHIHDTAWVGNLGITNLVWQPDSRYFYFISEKDGFAHLYRSSPEGSPKQLTSGEFEVYQARLSNDGNHFYLITNEEHPGERHLYIMNAGGGTRTKITTLEGQHTPIISPDETTIASLFSSSNHPPELYLQPNRAGAQAEPITLSTTEEFRSYSWHNPEVITFEARDETEVYARLYQPRHWHPAKPSVIFIHGAGYLQNAHKGWSSYYREYMFHNFLMEKGYLVLDIDYRGSAGYGRDCRTATYRHMGGKDLDDIVDGARFLAEELGADPNRIGAYGGSYGGFLTLMAMFTQPDVFASGAALRPVTDWAHYHPGYTVNILNRPHNDPEAYEKSSPVHFAEGLEGALLICHGMVDTNVHFQDTVRLVQRLIELGKENWEAAIYPVEGHSFRNPSSWTDEYKRIFKLFEETLREPGW
ncbi:MAG: S9 family peptidase [Candidatus Aminicenantes bacterium]